jgi:hypothetical protein
MTARVANSASAYRVSGRQPKLRALGGKETIGSVPRFRYSVR